MAVPLFHITSLCNVFLWSLPAGQRLVVMHKWDAGKALDTIERYQVTAAAASFRLFMVLALQQDSLAPPWIGRV